MKTYYEVRVRLDPHSSHSQSQVSSVSGETVLNTYMWVQQLSNDTVSDPLMWWKHHQQEFPRLVRMSRQYLLVSPSSVSPG
jgi:hypothetical protein